MIIEKMECILKLEGRFKKMKITLTELRMIIREEILAEKKRRKKKRKDVFQNDMVHYPNHPYPYHQPPTDLTSHERPRREDEDYEMYYSGITLA